MRVRSLGYRTDLALLRLGGSEIEDREDHLVVRTPHNPGFWWGNFLLLAEIPAAEAVQGWLGRFAAEFADARHLALGIDQPQAGPDSLAPFAQLGCRIEASTVLTARDVRPPAHPNTEAVCRALVDEDDWRRSAELSARCHQGDTDGGADPELDCEPHREPDRVAPNAYTLARVRTNQGLVENGHGAWFGAFLDGTLVAQLGLILAGGGLARFQSVETDPRFRRRGLAGSLLHHASRTGFDHLGAEQLVIVADPDYVAIDLYRAVGFTAAEQQLQVER